MEKLTDAPKGPYSDEGICVCPQPSFRSFSADSNIEATLDSIVGLLVLPAPIFPDLMSHESLVSLSPFREDIDKIHREVQFCLWAMNISLSVYMKLLNLVDISVRREISDNVSRYLAEWKEGRSDKLSDSLDALIISEFTKHSVTEIPDMERLQREQECRVLGSTVACYIKDIAIKFDSMRQGDMDATIEIIFPSSKNFIGRCFFPRLAAVAGTLLELINGSFEMSNIPSESSQLSTNSTVNS
jgi:hypothetical protein